MNKPSKNVLRLGHSPDPDDAFMWYPLANFVGPGNVQYRPKIDTRGYEFVHILEDIQSLNERCENAELEITALSIHQYPFVADRYQLTSCGSSMGDNYGPMVIYRAGSKVTLDSLKSRQMTIAIPGVRTSAFLSLSLLLGKDSFQYKVVPFDQIIQRVASGEFDAGLIIHEGQLTFKNAGLECLVDLGAWWTQKHNLPLPLGGNAIRRDLGGQIPVITRVLLDSIEYALNHREDAVGFAMNYARDMGKDLADKFVGMYVNKWTLDYGDRGRKAVNLFLKEASEKGITPDIGDVDFATPV